MPGLVRLLASTDQSSNGKMFCRAQSASLEKRKYSWLVSTTLPSSAAYDSPESTLSKYPRYSGGRPCQSSSASALFLERVRSQNSTSLPPGWLMALNSQPSVLFSPASADESRRVSHSCSARASADDRLDDGITPSPSSLELLFRRSAISFANEQSSGCPTRKSRTSS